MKKISKLLLVAGVILFTGCDSESVKNEMASAIDSTKKFGEDVYNKTSFKTDELMRQAEREYQYNKRVESDNRNRQIMRSHNAPNRHMRQAY